MGAKSSSSDFFEIKEGEIFGFLGPSGSGKTTMINVLTGQLAADQGKTVLLGKNSQDLTSNDLEQIGIVSDGSGFYEKMSLYKICSFTLSYMVSSQIE